MRNWDNYISIEAEKISKRSENDLVDLLQKNAAVSKLLGASLDQMLNNLSIPELRSGITHHVVRNDPVHREWEATFSAVNMVGPVVTSLAMQGFYAAAICLLRHELEGVAQLKHILDGRRSTKYAPNISHLEERMRKWYPALSEIAHLSSDFSASMQAPLFGNPDNLALLPHGNSMLPVYNKKVAEEVISIHVEIRKELINRVDEHLQRIGIKISEAASEVAFNNQDTSGQNQGN